MPHGGSSEIQDYERTIAQLNARIERLSELKDDLKKRLERQAKEIRERELLNAERAEAHERQREKTKQHQDDINSKIRRVAAETKAMEDKNLRLQKSYLNRQLTKYAKPTYRNQQVLEMMNDPATIAREIRTHSGTNWGSQGGAMAMAAGKDTNGLPRFARNRPPPSKPVKKSISNPRLVEPDGIRHGLVKSNLLEFFHLSP